MRIYPLIIPYLFFKISTSPLGQIFILSIILSLIKIKQCFILSIKHLF